ncbi:MAG: hypothetical protein ACTSXF_15455 [Promethearchaeota archaeon]
MGGKDKNNVDKETLGEEPENTLGNNANNKHETNNNHNNHRIDDVYIKDFLLNWFQSKPHELNTKKLSDLFPELSKLFLRIKRKKAALNGHLKESAVYDADIELAEFLDINNLIDLMNEIFTIQFYVHNAPQNAQKSTENNNLQEYEYLQDYNNKNNNIDELTAEFEEYWKYIEVPLKRLASLILKNNFKNNIVYSVPGRTYPSLSVTGTWCALNCEHCNKKYLEIMRDISSEGLLIKELTLLERKGAIGALLSGGDTIEGKVPVLKYLDILKDYKRGRLKCYDEELQPPKPHSSKKEESAGNYCQGNLILNFHTGLLNNKEVKDLASLPPDVVSFDFTLDEDIIHHIYHLNQYTAEDYQETLNSFIESGINVVPHITLGLYFGHIKEELKALKYLKELARKKNIKYSLIVFIILIPPKNNPKFIIPKIEDVGKILLITRMLFPETELSLGCMRPRGKKYKRYEIDAINSCFNRIVIPSRDTQKEVENMGLNIIKLDACCAVPLNKVFKFKTKLN